MTDLTHEATCRPLGEFIAPISAITAQACRLAHSRTFADALRRCVSAGLIVVPRHGRDSNKSAHARLSRHAHSCDISFDPSRFPSLAIVANSSRNPATGTDGCDLRKAVAAVLLRPVLNQLHDLGLSNIELTSLECGETHADTAASRTSVARLILDLGEETVELDVESASPGFFSPLDAFLRAAGTTPAHFPPYIATLRVPGFACLGTQPVDVSALGSLRAGDVLLCSSLPAALGQSIGVPSYPISLEIYWGSRTGICVRAPSTLEFSTLKIMREPQMAEDTYTAPPSSSTPEGVIDLSGFEVPLRLEVETVHLTLTELATLAPGYVMELPVKLAEARVQLVAFGQTLGSGQLVAIGDQLGVRIIQMGAASDATE